MLTRFDPFRDLDRVFERPWGPSRQPTMPLDAYRHAESYVINVDVGTGSGRAIAFDEDGRQVAISQREWLPKVDPRYPGAQDFDCAHAWQLLSECLRDVAGQLGPRLSAVAAVTSACSQPSVVSARAML